MEIHRESDDKHTIQSYTEKSVKINNIVYDQSLIITREEISFWPIVNLEQIDEEAISFLCSKHPKIILIGHQAPNLWLPPQLMQSLNQQQIGIELLNIGAACRIFNILLSENRDVLMVLIFPS